MEETLTNVQAEPDISGVDAITPRGAQVDLPRSDFTATVATRWDGTLYACSRLWDGYAMGCPVLESTPLKDAQWATLHAYMQRRFGLGHMGADDYKDLGAGWMLTTPDPAVFVDVCPSLSGAGFSFTPRCADQGASEHLHLGASSITPERIETIKAAYRDTLLDLLRPVCVRDQYINALGEVEDEALLEDNEDTEEPAYEVQRHPSSGYSMPVGLFGGQDWAVLCSLIRQLGGGDMVAGRQAAIERLQRPALDEIAQASWPVQRLVLLGCNDPDGLAARLGFSADLIATFDAERQSLAQTNLPALVDEITDAALHDATDFLARVGLGDGGLPSRVKSMRVRKSCDDAWAELVTIAKDDFPDAAMPKNLWDLGAELPSAIKAGLREHGREDLVSWVDRTMARAGGLQALQQIAAHIVSQSTRHTQRVSTSCP